MNVLDWLLDSDPSIRWQVLRDLTDAPADTVASERARVAEEGWGARLLALRDPDGLWAHGACFPDTADLHRPGGELVAARLAAEFAAADDEDSEDWPGQPWTATYPTLDLLREFGIDPDHPTVRETTALIALNCLWEQGGQPFFAGEVEPCINGRTLRLAHYYGHPEHADSIAARLLGEQLDDGGWNCEAERGSTRSSFHSTLSVLQGLLAHEQATGGTGQLIEARRRGEEYLLMRHLARRLSTAEIVDPAWLELSFPTQWHYDVLHCMEYFRDCGSAPDPRAREAVDVVRGKCQPDGRWLLENTHPGAQHFALEDGDGRPSRWITLRALRVLRWADGSE